jgi:hypothetical protein
MRVIVLTVETDIALLETSVSISYSASLKSVSVYISQLVADDSDVIDETRMSGRLCEGRLSLTHTSMSLSSIAESDSEPLGADVECRTRFVDKVLEVAVLSITRDCAHDDLP